MARETREHSLDGLARGLASGSLSRRKALRLMGSVLVGSALASVPGVAWANDDDDRCPEGQTRCGERCVNLKTNERHCGSCRNRCASNQTCCNGNCVNLQRNERHCGSCLNRCPERSECVAGVCQCPSGTMLCGGACVSNNTCCCHCQYLDPVTGQRTVVCNSPTTATTPDECHQMCAANIPPGLEHDSSGFGCNSELGGNSQLVCAPVSEPNKTGLACFTATC